MDDLLGMDEEEAIRHLDRQLVADLAIGGEDLRDAGIPPGPLLGKILQSLLAWVVEDPSRNTRDALLRKALELYRETL